MRRLVLLAAPFVATLVWSAVAAQTSFPDTLAGEWAGSGTVTGRASAISMTWSREPGGAFLHLRFRNAMEASAARPVEVFEGRGYYATRGAIAGTGTWVDSRGIIMPLTFTAENQTLTSDWGSERTERGRTVYRLVDRNTLEVIDFVRAADGEYREFGRSSLKRRADAR